MPGYFCLIDSVSSQGFPVTTFLVFCLNIQQLLWLSPALWLLVFPRFTFLNPLNLCGGETTNSGCNWNNNHLPSSLVLFLTTTVIAGQQKCFMNNCRFFTRNIEKHYSGGSQFNQIRNFYCFIKDKKSTLFSRCTLLVWANAFSWLHPSRAYW